MIEATCHCGAVRIELAARPDVLKACNCSLCRRIGGPWVYYHPKQVSFTRGAGTTVAYIQGDRTLAMHHCPTCGCVTHWESTDNENADRMGINAGLIDPEEIKDLPVRHFDGADTWTYLD